MCPIVRNIRNAVSNAYNNKHPETLAEVVGNPQTGRGSGGNNLIKEAYHKTYIRVSDGTLVTIKDRLS